MNMDGSKVICPCDVCVLSNICKFKAQIINLINYIEEYAYEKIPIPDGFALGINCKYQQDYLE